MTSAAPAAIDINSTADTKWHVERVVGAVRRFMSWLDRYGETSYDVQTV
jgi:hypothetical protein